MQFFQTNKNKMITTKQRAILKKIKETGVDFHITGSISLSILKIIRRPINDLDIVVKSREDLKKLYEIFGGKLFQNYEKIKDDETDLLLNANQIRTKIDSENVCVFLTDVEETMEVPLENGEFYNIAYPHSIINAKFNMVYNLLNKKELDDAVKKILNKHLSDIHNYCIFVQNQKID